MTEAEWLACADPYRMVVSLGDGASRRKLRLFACAVGRRLWGRFTQESIRRAVELGERVADGLAAATPEELVQICSEASKDAGWPGKAGRAAAASVSGTASSAALVAAHLGGQTGLRKAGVRGVLVEVFGNPFRPVVLAPDLRTPLVISLAQAAYDERHLPSGHLDAERLLILADALEDAGCRDAALLEHLRAPGPHVRGCHVVDWLLAKQ